MTDTPDTTPAEARTAFVDFWSGAGPWIAGGHAEAEDVAHEAFHAGWHAAAPVIAARATAAEREACIRLARDHNAVVLRHDDPTNPVHACELPFADLLGGASHSAQTAPAAPGSVPKVTGPGTSHQAVSSDPGATQGHT